jgi:hypothetical protein
LQLSVLEDALLGFAQIFGLGAPDAADQKPSKNQSVES